MMEMVFCMTKKKMKGNCNSMTKLQARDVADMKLLMDNFSMEELARSAVDVLHEMMMDMRTANASNDRHEAHLAVVWRAHKCGLLSLGCERSRREPVSDGN